MVSTELEHQQLDAVGFPTTTDKFMYTYQMYQMYTTSDQQIMNKFLLVASFSLRKQSLH